MGAGVVSAAGCLLSEDTVAAGSGVFEFSFAIVRDCSGAAVLSGLSFFSGVSLSTGASVSLLSEGKMLSVLSVSASALVSLTGSFISVGAVETAEHPLTVSTKSNNPAIICFFIVLTSFVVMAPLYGKPQETSKVGISALTGICRYSFSRIVTGSIKGERCGEGEADTVAIHPCRKRADFALGVRLSLLASLPLQVSVVELQRLDDKIRFLPSGD